MSQKMFDWFPLPTVRRAADAPRRMLADLLGFPATPLYATEDSPEEPADDAPKQLPGPKARTSPRKKRRRKSKRRSR